MLRGLSRSETRWRRKRRIRCATGESSLSISRWASMWSSTFHAIPFHHFLQRHGFGATFADSAQAFFSDLQIFEIVEVSEDGLAGVVRFGASGAFCQAVQAF